MEQGRVLFGLARGRVLSGRGCGNRKVAGVCGRPAFVYEAGRRQTGKKFSGGTWRDLDVFCKYKYRGLFRGKKAAITAFTLRGHAVVQSALVYPAPEGTAGGLLAADGHGVRIPLGD